MLSEFVYSITSIQLIADNATSIKKKSPYGDMFASKIFTVTVGNGLENKRTKKSVCSQICVATKYATVYVNYYS